MKELGHSSKMSTELLSNLQTEYIIVKNLNLESKFIFFID